MKIIAKVDRFNQEVVVTKKSGEHILTLSFYKESGHYQANDMPGSVTLKSYGVRSLWWNKDYAHGCWSLDDLLYEERIKDAIEYSFPGRFKTIEVQFYETNTRIS